jgi:hypothetical protein
LSLIVSFLLFYSSFNCHASLKDHFDFVEKKCSSASSLLVKKSALELNQSQDCGQTFTAQLISKCAGLSCEQLINSYKKNAQGRSGSVVGE